MPSKPSKYGISIWVVCDARSSYAWKMQVYTRKPSSGTPKKNQRMWVVVDVTDRLRGHNVMCDNFITTYELSQQLLKRKITMVGRVRKNKPELPLHSLQQGGERPSHHSLPSTLPPDSIFLLAKEEQECGPPEHTA
ncbi:hypothetical protein PGIGA_G00032940 [Pangasianodon gigas]|uniref:Uncharacterized protein n=1 Tax=Pangasianodon gigas TaxID=30993 RepID=A0ACC5WYY0_PANGG|nr:hypothetical protein [Pangasianodon gigas]